MNQYFNLTNQLDWTDIIKSVQPEAYCYIDKNNGDFILGWDKLDEIVQDLYEHTIINDFRKKHCKSYLFGFLSYDIKNVLTSNLNNKNNDLHQFPDSIYFEPKHVVVSKNGHLMYFGTKSGFQFIKSIENSYSSEKSKNTILLKPSTNQHVYHQNIERIQKLLQNGDIYEMNYCMQFYKSNTVLDVVETYKTLKNKTKAPFSSLFKFNDYHILSGSPERFISKTNNTLKSQPIKGTAPRSTDQLIDNQIKQTLLKNPKEISENVMIVDLVRNDLSKIALKNSVQTPELCKLYTFETVHQLISTVVAKIDENLDFESIIKALFPMGSMTGAPKFNAMKIIEEVENFKRGIYSGSIGYFTPNNNYDSNVVIRSIIYNEKLQNVSVSVGGAITIKSEANKEYEECLLKLKSIVASIKV